MVITRAISQRVLVGASIISLLLIAGSVYLHLQQKPHLGRMNASDGRGKTTDSVEKLSKDDVPPLHTKPSNSKSINSITSNSNSHNAYNDDIYDDDYPNDATSNTNSNETKSKEDPKATHKSSTVPYLIDKAYGTDLDIKYVNPNSGDKHLNATDTLSLTQHCFHCLCTTVNGCKPFKCAHIDPCGIYGISKYYWLDGGSPTATEENDNDYGEENEAHLDYLRCVNNNDCAVKTVTNYIKRYQRDCNNDGIIDCQDYITLHILGPSGCYHKQLSPIHKIRMNSCLK